MTTGSQSHALHRSVCCGAIAASLGLITGILRDDPPLLSRGEVLAPWFFIFLPTVLLGLAIGFAVSRASARAVRFVRGFPRFASMDGFLLPAAAIASLEVLLAVWMNTYDGGTPWFDNPYRLWGAAGAVIFSSVAAVGWAAKKKPAVRRLTYGVMTLLPVVLILSPGFRASGFPRGLLPFSPPPVSPVVFITIDTLRADALGCYDPRAGSTPNLDGLARDGVLFERAFSAAPWTLPSLSSIMTGVAPAVHGVLGPEFVLSDKFQTMAELFQQQGYFTGAVGYSPYVARRYRLTQGFDSPHFFETGDVISGVMELSRDWIKSNRRRRFFLWIHIFDPHQPYDPPAEYRPSGAPPASIGWRFDRIMDVRRGDFAPNADEKTWIRNLYDAEVRWVDDHVGSILDTLREFEIYDDALIVLTSDHGEELWDHGGYEHGHTLYNELLRVPLIIKPSGNSPSRTAASWVSTQDLLPTLSDLCGLGVPREGMSGESFAHLVGPTDPHDESGPLFSAGVRKKDEMEAVYLDGLKFIRSGEENKTELYDLGTDFAEQTPLAPDHPAAVRAAQALAEHARRCGALKAFWGVDAPERTEIDPAARRALEGLGYLD